MPCPKPVHRQKKAPRSRGPCCRLDVTCYSSGTSSSATMLMILIRGLIAGPAVSLQGSPTVSPVTAALCASEPLPPWLTSSMYFLAFSQAPPPVVIELATNRPETMVPINRPPTACAPAPGPPSPLTPTLATTRTSHCTQYGPTPSFIHPLISLSAEKRRARS